MKKPSKRTARVGVLVAGAVGLVGALLPSQVEAAPAAPALVVPAWSNQDPITGCRDEYDSGVVGNSPIAFGLLQNDIPRGITISKWMLGDPIPGTGKRKKVGTVYGKGRLVTPEAPEVWLGQRTPLLEGGSVTDAKKITSGASFLTDHWWGSMDNVGCQTNIGYVIGQGKSDVATAFNYDGDIWRAGVEKWWALPKEYAREGQMGYVKFTCRGTPTGKVDTYWEKVNTGDGFRGSSLSKANNQQEAGRAPACQDEVFKDSRVRHFWDMTYYGNSEPRTNRGCTTDSRYNTLGCYQLMYQGPWKRTIRFETHAWAPALKARIASSATITIPAKYSTADVQRSVTRKLSWRVTDSTISGSWPSGYRESRFTKPGSPEAFQTLSPYTVPAGGDRFVLSGWGNVKSSDQYMEFRLTADTDGTWVWPTDPVTGDPMERPAVVIRVGYTLGNFDSNSGSCTAGEYWKNLKPLRDDACIQGFVPTTWGVPTDQGERERRVFRSGKDANGNEMGSTATFKSTPISGNWLDSELKVQNLSTDAPGTVSANVSWDINLSGQIDGRDL